jgi:hypothetical protein
MSGGGGAPTVCFGPPVVQWAKTGPDSYNLGASTTGVCRQEYALRNRSRHHAGTKVFRLFERRFRHAQI